MIPYNDVILYFKEKAEDYDLVDTQVYWRLSDKILWYAMEKYVINNLHKAFNFLDAGGGTGRWSLKILESYIDATGTIYDLSEDMLRQAEKKKNKRIIGDRLQLIQGNIEEMSDIKDQSFDLSFNFHNVLGFVNSPNKALREIVRVTKKDGYVVSLVPNKYHAIFFNILVNRLDEAEVALGSGRGRFTTNMPYINLFTPETIMSIYKEIGLEVTMLTGFPVSIYPGMQETQISGSTKSITDILDNNKNFNRIFEIEKKLIEESSIAARGNNLLIIGKKIKGD